MSFDDFRELAMQLRMNSIYVEDKLNIFLTSIFSNSQIVNKYINNYNDINEETEIQPFFKNKKRFFFCLILFKTTPLCFFFFYLFLNI